MGEDGKDMPEFLTTCLVADIAPDLVLGLTFLREHKPTIDWHGQNISLQFLDTDLVVQCNSLAYSTALLWDVEEEAASIVFGGEGLCELSVVEEDKQDSLEKKMKKWHPDVQACLKKHRMFSPTNCQVGCHLPERWTTRFPWRKAAILHIRGFIVSLLLRIESW